MNLLNELFCSKVRSELLRVLFGASLELHLRDIQRHTRLALNGIRRDLEKLRKMDLVSVRRDGNRVYFKANPDHPLFSDIQNIVLKTAGLVDILKSELRKAPEIRVAFVFGSIARGERKPEAILILW